MSSWEQALAALRGEFLAEAEGRLQRMAAQIDLLGAGVQDTQPALNEIKRGFHAFAGSGTTYGFPQVTEVGSRGERELMAVAPGPVPPEALERWRKLVAELRAALVPPA